jgi:hypothetical protein
MYWFCFKSNIAFLFQFWFFVSDELSMMACEAGPSIQIKLRMESAMLVGKFTARL